MLEEHLKNISPINKHICKYIVLMLWSASVHQYQLVKISPSTLPALDNVYPIMSEQMLQCTLLPRPTFCFSWRVSASQTPQTCHPSNLCWKPSSGLCHWVSLALGFKAQGPWPVEKSGYNQQKFWGNSETGNRQL